MAASIARVATPFAGNVRALSAKSTSAKPVRSVVTMASDRPMWYPGATAPKYLDGTIPGDYGFDPLRLGGNANLLPYFKEAELTNARWAMMAVPGVLLTEATGGVDWWMAGAEPTAIPTNTLIAAEVAIMGFLEYKRIEGWKRTGGSGFLNFFPFDPLGMSSDEMKVKEIKNGRLAMCAFAGFLAQAAVQGAGPIACFKDHLDNGATVYTTEFGAAFTLGIFFLNCWPIFNQASKALGDDQDDDFRAIPW